MSFFGKTTTVSFGAISVYYWPMPQRGSYPKGVAKREELVSVALEVVAERGYNGATLREVSEAAGLSKTGVLHHFANKEELFTEVLSRRDELNLHALDADSSPAGATLADTLATGLQRNAMVPGLVQLYSRLSADATDPENPAHSYFEERYVHGRNFIEDVVRQEKEQGLLAPSIDPRMFGVILLALSDGLQMQWMFNPELDMAAHMQHLFDTLAPPRETTNE